jgi:hypothetical protein
MKDENAKPPRHELRTYSKQDQEKINKKLDRLISAGYIVPSKTPFISPLMVSR